MDFDSEVLRFAAQSNERIEQMFNDYFDELAAIGIKTPKDSGVFSFEKDVPPQYREKVDQLTKSFQERLYKEIHAGVDVAYGISLAKHTALLNALFPEGLNVHQPRRKDAREAFIRQRTKPSGRLSLSDRVWNYANQGKAEVEAAMSLAIEDGVVQGKTAAELGRSLRKYLNDPDRMYRRYHTTITLEDGSKKDIVTWRKRVIGPDGKVHFVECEIDKPGQGVYISARANAERCSRSEINGAYRYADYERWNDEEFVIGIKISLSNNHTILEEKKVGKKHIKTPVPFHDICDDLQGNYPKTFKWAGWHPQCRCHATAITASKEDRKQWLAEGCPPGFFDKKYITDAPPQMVKWLNENMDKVQRAKSLPYWIQDNLKMRPSAKGEEKVFQMFGVGMKKPAALLMSPSKLTPLEIAAQRHAARTPEHARAIQEAWNERTATRYRASAPSFVKDARIKYEDALKLYGDTKRSFGNTCELEIIKKIEAMSHRQADGMRCNPRFGQDGSYTNCQASVVTYALRREGYLVRAALNDGGDLFSYLEQYPQTAWIDKKTGRAPRTFIAGGKAVGEDRRMYTKSRSQMYKEFNEITKKEGLYQIMIDFERCSGYGHTIVAERLSDGSLMIFDPQRGTHYKWKDYLKKVDIPNGIEVLPLEGLRFNSKYSAVLEAANN